MSIPPLLLVHTATVKPYQGSGPYGDVFGDPFDLPCYMEQTRQIVTSQSGDQVLSEAQVYANPTGSEFVKSDGSTGQVPEIPTGSEVTVNGYTSTVITVSVFDDSGLTGLAHQEIALA